VRLVDLDHAVSAATLGRMDAPDRWQASEDAFWAHLARRTDGGPVTPPQLVYLAREAPRANPGGAP